MTATTEPTTIRHKVGTCPACRCGIWADFDVVVEIGTPVITRDTASDTARASVTANPRFVAGRLAHQCLRGEDGEWTYPAATPNPESEAR